jgi:hypothetical protein
VKKKWPVTAEKKKRIRKGNRRRKAESRANQAAKAKSMLDLLLPVTGRFAAQLFGDHPAADTLQEFYQEVKRLREKSRIRKLYPILDGRECPHSFALDPETDPTGARYCPCRTPKKCIPRKKK